jgi:hypothetical protein
MHFSTGDVRTTDPRERGLDADAWVLLVSIEDVIKRVPSPPAASDRSDYAQGRDDFRDEMLDALDRSEGER